MSKTAWKKRKEHTVTLPSGQEVTIALPNLPALVKSGAIPNELIDVAIGSDGGREPGKVDVEQISKLADFQRYLVSITVVEPKVTQEEVDDLPYEDTEMLVEFATRQRDFDAVGHHLAGLETVQSFREFRQIDSGLAGLVGT